MTGKEALDLCLDAAGLSRADCPEAGGSDVYLPLARTELARLRDNDSLYLGLRAALKFAGCALRPVAGSTGGKHEALFNDRAAALEKKLTKVAEIVRALSVELEVLPR